MIGFIASTPQPNNTIILNATGNDLSGIAGQTASFYVAPIRSDNTQTLALAYNTTTKEITTSTGVAGAISLIGTAPSDYIYWDGNAWVVGTSQVRLGSNAALTTQGSCSVAIGADAGQTQSYSSVAVGVVLFYLFLLYY